jgi:hypothetical protein
MSVVTREMIIEACEKAVRDLTVIQSWTDEPLFEGAPFETIPPALVWHKKQLRLVKRFAGVGKSRELLLTTISVKALEFGMVWTNWILSHLDQQRVEDIFDLWMRKFTELYGPAFEQGFDDAVDCICPSGEVRLATAL